MNTTRDIPPAHDPIEASLTQADDRILLNTWLPPRTGVTPKVRILWALPIVFVCCLRRV